MAEMPRPELPSEPIADVFGDWVTSQFSKQQSKAGRKLGVAPGASLLGCDAEALGLYGWRFVIGMLQKRWTLRKHHAPPPFFVLPLSPKAGISSHVGPAMG